MSPQAISAAEIERLVGVIGAPGFGDGGGGRTGDRHGLLMMGVETLRLGPGARDFEGPGGGVGYGLGRPSLGAVQPALGEIERIPPQTEPAAQQDQDDHRHARGDRPAQRRQGADQPAHR
jgi:hypothetical protein